MRLALDGICPDAPAQRLEHDQDRHAHAGLDLLIVLRLTILHVLCQEAVLH